MSTRDPVLVGAGDIARCDGGAAVATARLLKRIEGTVVALGDLVYPSGTAERFRTCYQRTWGRYKARTRPVVGNHEYLTDRAKPYFDYFGDAAGDPDKGYYSFDLGAWHVVVLNSNCGFVSCDTDSAQAKWLREDLKSSPAQCQIALWHHPYFTSGSVHKPETVLRPLFQILVDFGVEANLAGHNHQYERFAPQLADGTPDEAKGVRAFVVGTGGASHYSFDQPQRNSVVRDGSDYGVLKLALHSDSYDWDFVPIEGSFSDTGSGTCH